jgi:SAM-dependent methyltransferase
MVVSPDEVVSYIKKNFPNYPICFLEEYLFHKKIDKKRTFQNTQSDKQISAILKISETRSGMKNYHRLMNILAKTVSLKNYRSFLSEILGKKDVTDTYVYDTLRKYSKTSKIANTNNKTTSKKEKQKGGSENKSKCGKDEIRSELFFYQICKHLFGKNKKNSPTIITNYLDIGCGDCSLTRILGKKFGLSSRDIYGADLKKWFNYENRNTKGMQFKLIEEGKKLPFSDGQFSMVSAFMVLHHTKDVSFLLSEIYRITQNGGYFVIREHDCLTKADSMLADIEHAVYERVYKDGKQEFFRDFYASYHDWMQWSFFLHSHGFEQIFVDYDQLTVYYDVMPTRSFLGIYQKV